MSDRPPQPGVPASRMARIVREVCRSRGPFLEGVNRNPRVPTETKAGLANDTRRLENTWWAGG